MADGWVALDDGIQILVENAFEAGPIAIGSEGGRN
jgi:hypothetical protein